MSIEPAPDPTPDPDKPKAKPTRYVVLRERQFVVPPEGVQPPPQGQAVSAWVKVGEAESASDVKAIEKVAGAEQGTFVAVPARSWRPRTRKVKTVEQTSWE